MQNTLITEMTERLTTEQNSINALIAELDATYKTQRGELVSQLAPIAAMLKAANGGAGTATGNSYAAAPKRVMSEAGRENIRRAMAARRERLAALGSVPPAEIKAGAPEGTGEQSEATENATAKKSAKKGAAK